MSCARLQAYIYVRTNYDLLLRKEERHQVQTEKDREMGQMVLPDQKPSTSQDNWRDRLFDGTRPIKRVVTSTDRIHVAILFKQWLCGKTTPLVQPSL